MKAIIADDERHLAEDLRRRLVRLWPELEIAAVLHDGIAARDAIDTLQPEIAFLDIKMPGMTGLEVARTVPATCRVVFVTAYDQYAITAFEQAAADYLLKPVSDERLLHSIERLRQPVTVDYPAVLAQLNQLMQTRSEPSPLRWLRVQQGDQVRLLPVSEVCYFKSDEKYTSVFTRDTEYLIRTPLKELLPQLDSNEFWQVHRGTIVNVSQIASAQHDETGKVTLRMQHRKEVLAVSRSYAQLFKHM